ncbi:FKBP-type peptidyl-prolyl cis-trans isomerase [Arenimonas oryziterrae]|uniref:Peptidyl-prolyl cis-trans isomerase n=1 Tax=Arenimonas oryziterrae DSM 21050 = YC6267 TaxID=1121015 RepID=A0A091BEJ1_9GAMM|nr:FKBP-type peptidyl-prolyl cis-trans isomerase [Arenimonas oryziterrae]KFN42815.1 hypothetical protein N789_11840 [Arenimonas oryziterrae DSM 21050 = YC6267]
MRVFFAFVIALLLAACTAPTPSGGRVAELMLIDEKVGTGAVAGPGMDVVVQYTGWLYDEKAADKHGEKFDSSFDHGGEPFVFFLGGRQVIRGWDEGIEGMRVGGRRTLMIPPDKAYGDEGAGNGVIPPGASLVFDVELVDVRPRK